MEQEPGRELYILLEGEVRCYRYDVKGNMITLPFHTRHDLLGELPVEGEPVIRRVVKVKRYAECFVWMESDSVSWLQRIYKQHIFL